MGVYGLAGFKGSVEICWSLEKTLCLERIFYESKQTDKNDPKMLPSDFLSKPCNIGLWTRLDPSNQFSGESDPGVQILGQRTIWHQIKKSALLS